MRKTKRDGSWSLLWNEGARPARAPEVTHGFTRGRASGKGMLLPAAVPRTVLRVNEEALVQMEKARPICILNRRLGPLDQWGGLWATGDRKRLVAA